MNQEKSLKMKTYPIGKLISSMSFPAMFSMLIQALYNIVDSIYVSRINEGNDNNINALGFAFAIQILMMAFSLGIGIGTNVLVARKLGEKKPEESSKYAQTGLVMAFITGILFFILSFIIIEPYMNWITDNKDISEKGIDYLRIVMMFSMFMMIEIVCNKILQGTGRMVVAMFTQLIGAITNIILDPILIFGWFGLPAMGVSGAAIATVIGQLAAMLFVTIYLLKQKLEIQLGLKGFRFRKTYVVQIIRVGLPSMAINAIGSAVNIVLNSILKELDPINNTGNGVLTVYFKLQSFIFMPVLGLNQGGLPILSYNFGANDRNRYRKALRILLISALSIIVVGFLIFQTFPGLLLSIFNTSDELLNLGVKALKIISLGFIPAALGIIITMAFQSVGYGEAALIMTLLRQAVLLLPFAYILSNYGGLNTIWYSFPIAEGIVALVFTPLIFIITKRAFRKRDTLIGGLQKDGH